MHSARVSGEKLSNNLFAPPSAHTFKLHFPHIDAVSLALKESELSMTKCVEHPVCALGHRKQFKWIFSAILLVDVLKFSIPVFIHHSNDDRFSGLRKLASKLWQTFACTRRRHNNRICDTCSVPEVIIVMRWRSWYNSGLSLVVRLYTCVFH